APQLDDQDALSLAVEHRDRGLVGPAQRLQPAFELEGQADLFNTVGPPDLCVLQIHLSHLQTVKLHTVNYPFLYYLSEGRSSIKLAFFGALGQKPGPPRPKTGRCAHTGPEGKQKSPSKAVRFGRAVPGAAIQI